MNMPIASARSFATAGSTDQPRETPPERGQDDFADFFVVSAAVQQPQQTRPINPVGEERSSAPSEVDSAPGGGVAGPTESQSSSPGDAPIRPEILPESKFRSSSPEVQAETPSGSNDGQEVHSSSTESVEGATAQAELLDPLASMVRETLGMPPNGFSVKLTQISKAMSSAMKGGDEDDLGADTPASAFDPSDSEKPNGPDPSPVVSGEVAVEQAHGEAELATVRAAELDTFATDSGSPEAERSEPGESLQDPPDLGGQAAFAANEVARPGREVGAAVGRANIPEQVAAPIVQIIDALRLGTPNRSKTLKLRLNPEELGSVEITVVRNASGSVSTTILTERESASAALNEHVAQLRDSLERAGVQLEKLEVNFRPSSGSDLGQGGRQDTPSRGRTDVAQPASINDHGGVPEVKGEIEDRLVSLRA